MILKKMMRMSVATGKNYEDSQVLSIQNQTSRLVRFVWELADLIKSPLTFIYCSYRLYNIVGVCFIPSVLLASTMLALYRHLYKDCYTLVFEA